MKAANNQNLAHLWASQNVDSATGSNFSFKGTKLYSYSTVVGNIIKDKNGECIVLLSEHGYSNTTRKHLSLAHSAVKHLDIFSTKIVDPKYINKPFEQIIAGARELISDYLETLPEKFRTDTQKANGVYIDINHQIGLIARLGDSSLTPINSDNAVKWRADYLGGIVIANVEKTIGDALDDVKLFNKYIEDGHTPNCVSLYKGSIDNLVAAKNKAEALGLKLPTGTHTELKKAKRNLPIAAELVYASALSRAIADYRGAAKSLCDSSANLTLLAKTLYKRFRTYEQSLNAFLSTPPTFVLPVPPITPLATPRDYLPLDMLHDLILIERQIEAHIAQRVDNWRACNDPLDALSDLNDIYLRIKGDSIETSHSAAVPLSVAKKVWRLIKLAVAKSEDLLHDFGESARIGHYTLNAVYKDGSIKVGCHKIAYFELESMAEKLGLN